MSLKPFTPRRILGLQIFDLAVILLGILAIEAFLPVNVSFARMRPLFWALVPLVIIIFQLAGVYRVLSERPALRWCRQVLIGWALVLGAFFTLLYLTKSAEVFPRSVILIWMVAVPVVLVLSRLVLYKVLKRRLRHGKGGQRLLLVGDLPACRRFHAHLARHHTMGLRCIGICANGGASLPEVARRNLPIPWLGRTDELPRIIERERPDRVVLVTAVGSASQGRQLAELQGAMKSFALPFDFAPEVATSHTGPLQASDCAGRPLFTITGSPLSPFELLFKWVEDKVVALVAIVVFSPIFVLAAILVKFSSPGPVLFVQTRHGLYGKPIRVMKFRTMRQVSAAAAEAATKGREATQSGRFLQASASDDRITWIGKWLRKTSLDELPQFFNVLRGDMSVVGPRPHPIGLNHQFAEEVDQLMHRHLMKPGITGLAQISGARGETSSTESMRRRVDLDLQYIRTWSPWLDMKIILLTPFKGFLNYEP
ncbi:MAG: exopolysaccharide biosynthesis polyprenyl glycosylphosphotransferase [Planctomycetota bacterium]|nr:MAG: exopolysaccharide biosynthesis polyprenyl glycosylphosphotransferase [Planctomycetota bacterium]